MIQEDMEYMGPVRMCDVEEAEEKIMEVARKEIKYTPFMRFLSILGIAAVLVAAVYMAQLMGLLL